MTNELIQSECAGAAAGSDGSGDALRILYVSTCWPHGAAFGGRLRALQLGRALQKFGRPSLVLVGADEVDEKAKARTAEEFDVVREMKLHPAPVRGVRARAESWFGRGFTNTHGLSVSLEDEAWMAEAQRKFDLIWFAKLRTANMFRNPVWRNSVVDIDDLPSAMEESALRQATGAVARLKARLRALQMRMHEGRLADRFDILAVCSEADRASLGGGSSIHVIPNGFQRPNCLPQRAPAPPPRIGFIGLFDYEPNAEGVRWFVERCFPLIQKKIPGVRLRLVGEGTDGPDQPKNPAIDGLGWVDDPAEEMGSWGAMIVPIRVGAGTRVKIPDGFSRKCPVVATSLGAFGYDVRSGRELMIADAPEEFAAACISLLENPVAAGQMAERAYDAFTERWTWDAIAPRVWAAAEDCLRRSSAERQFPFLPARVGGGREEDPLMKMESAPKVSVIIPTYNRAEFVVLALESVLSQTFKDYEVIVVDDGSTDATREALQSFATRIKYVYQENRGAAAARNKGLELATGEWVAFLDSDDEWLEDYLARQMESVREAPGLCMHVADCRFVELNGERISYFEMNGVRRKLKGAGRLRPRNQFNFIIQHRPWQLGSTIIRRRSVEEAGMFDISLRISEDLDLMARVALVGPVGFYSEQLVTVYRRRESIECLSGKAMADPLSARESDERIFRKLNDMQVLGRAERRVLARVRSQNRRAIGNILLASGKWQEARDAYKRAMKMSLSVRSLGKYLISASCMALAKPFGRGPSAEQSIDRNTP